METLGINESLEWLHNQNAVSFSKQEVEKLNDYFNPHGINVGSFTTNGEEYIFICRMLKVGTVYIDITQDDIEVSLEMVKVRRAKIEPNQPIYSYLIRSHYPEDTNGEVGLFGTIGDDWNSKAYICAGYDSFISQLNEIMSMTSNLRSAPKNKNNEQENIT